MSMELPIYIPLDEAVHRYRIDREALTQMVESGRIKAVQIDGRVAVDNRDIAIVASQIDASNSGDTLVSINEAARRVGLHSRIVWQWYKNGWLPAQGRGPNRVIFVSLNRAQLLAALHAKYGRQGRRLIPQGMDIQGALKA